MQVLFFKQYLFVQHTQPNLSSPDPEQNRTLSGAEGSVRISPLASTARASAPLASTPLSDRSPRTLIGAEGYGFQ